MTTSPEPAETAPFFELSLDLLCLANTDGYFLKVNPAFVETLGWSEAELLSRRFLDFVHPEDVESTLTEVAHLALGQRTIDFENRYRCADGSWRWLSWRSAADPRTGTIYAVARDVTQLRQARQEAERARATAEHASQSKSSFLANMSHELRTPLNAIIGYSEMLKEDFEVRQEAGDADVAQVVIDLERIRAAGRHLLGLINQVLDLSKVEAGRMEVSNEDIDLASLVEGVLTVVQPIVRQNGNELTTLVSPEAGEIHSDSTKVRQVLINLLSNAARFTHDGQVRLSVHPDGPDHVSLVVEDTGIGIEPAVIERLFEPFTQADASTTRRYGGTGLGLNISRRFAELLGGRIDATSAPGRGSRFHVRLPRVPPSSPPALPVADAPTTQAIGGEVLIIDDDPAACDLARRVLGQLGLPSLVATSGQQGLDLARRFPPRLVLLDVLMPGMDGWAVLQALRAIPGLAQVPVVLTSVLDEGELGFALGVAGYVTKPIDPEELSATMARFDLRPGIPEALVVEDEADARGLLVRALHRAGWRVREAVDGKEALEALEAPEGWRPDVVLLDLAMPRMDGFELLRRIRSSPDLADLAVIVVTARDLDEDERAFLAGSARRVLAKGPSLVDTLRDEVSRLTHPLPSRA